MRISVSGALQLSVEVVGGLGLPGPPNVHFKRTAVTFTQNFRMTSELLAATLYSILVTSRLVNHDIPVQDRPSPVRHFIGGTFLQLVAKRMSSTTETFGTALDAISGDAFFFKHHAVILGIGRGPVSVLPSCNLAWSKNSNETGLTHGYSQNQIIVWKYPSMQQAVSLTGHTYRVLYLAMTPNRQFIVTGANR